MPLLFILELVIFIFAIQTIGFWWTMLAYIAPSFVGMILLSLQSREVMTKIQTANAEGANPSMDVLKSAAPIIGSILFIIPGFLTRALGFALLFPPLRWFLLFLSTFLFFRKFIKKGMLLLQFGNGAFRVYTNVDTFRKQQEYWQQNQSQNQTNWDNDNGGNPRDVTPDAKNVIDVTPIKIETKKENK